MPVRKFFQKIRPLFSKGKPLALFHPLAEATEYFFFRAEEESSSSPHIRDGVDIKRWMILVVIALLPCIFFAIWNTGMQRWLYQEADSSLLRKWALSSGTLSDYFSLVRQDRHYLRILFLGLQTFLPIVLVSYTVGGLWEALFACWRKHPIAEGFLVTGILYALILPPSIPLWMVAVGISFGIIFGKEVFGGTGMNIINPALASRCFLFFTFPGQMTGDIWIGGDPAAVGKRLTALNAQSEYGEWDGMSMATPLGALNMDSAIKAIHVDAIAHHRFSELSLSSSPLLEKQWHLWKESHATLFSAPLEHFSQMSTEQLQSFVTDPFSSGGLGLSQEYFSSAYSFSSLKYGVGQWSDTHLFLANQWGSLGETSTLMCILGGLYLIYRRVASWKIMLSVIVGVLLTGFAFEYGSQLWGGQWAFWNPAKFTFPTHKHFLAGGLAFGLVFMATDPVSAPKLEGARVLYGLLIGFLVVLIRMINPAYPEGVMLAILMGNVFAPLFDRIVLQWVIYRRKRYVSKC